MPCRHPRGAAAPRVVIDTDAYNEIDDQFALVHVLLSPERANLEAVYAAPFHNARSEGPADGMRKSFEEIQRILDLLEDRETPVHEGATAWMAEASTLERTPAVLDLIDRACASKDQPLYVVAIGAPTNVSTALAIAPEIVGHVVVVWLGGNALAWRSAREFNLMQDIEASRLLLDSGVALALVPCLHVADHMITTREEIERYVRPAGKVGAFLADRYSEQVGPKPGTSKVTWDLAATGWLLDESWTSMSLTQSPILTDDLRWATDQSRHLIAEVTEVDRDAILGDLFERLDRRLSDGAP